VGCHALFHTSRLRSSFNLRLLSGG
jgi:hypothetical protein